MIAGLFLAASLQAAPASAHPVTDGLTDIFIAACIKGEARLDPATTKKQSWAELPTSMRNDFTNERHGEFYKITEPASAYLVVIRHNPPKADGVEMVCDLLSGGVHIPTAWSKIVTAATGKTPKVPRSGVVHHRMTFPQQRIRILLARRAMRATVFSEAAAAKLETCSPSYFVWSC
jgi:hypothetical protein